MTRERGDSGRRTDGEVQSSTKASPGTTARTAQLGVQRRVTPMAVPVMLSVQRETAHEDPFGMHLIDDSTQVHEAAARGVEGPGSALPHLEPIQEAFGYHDVSGVQAHVGGAAREASAAMGASAYATGNQVAFAGTPDLHTAAHEAAHVVQQRGGVQLQGGIGRDSDDYERHADAVADAVVRGESAEGLLTQAPNRTASGAAVQHKKPASADDPKADDPKLEKQAGQAWPVFAKSGLPYLLEDRGGRPGFWAVRDWIAEATVGNDPKTGALIAPSRAREILTAMGWVEANLEFASRSLTFQFHGGISHFVVGAQAAWATGLPAGRQSIVERNRERNDELVVTLALDDSTVAPGGDHELTTSELTRTFKAASDFTDLGLDSPGLEFMMSQWVRPKPLIGNGAVTIDLNRAACRTLFGQQAFDKWAGGKAPAKPDDTKTPKLKLDNFYKSPIPGHLTHYGDIVEAGEALRLEVKVDWPHYHADHEIYEAPPMVTPSKFGNVALLQCGWRFERLDGADPGGATETKATSVAEAVHRFRLAAREAKGTFRVTCDARFDEYFEPATFTRDVVVMSSAEAMAGLKSDAFAGLGADDTDRSKGSWSGDVRQGFKASPAVGTAADVADPMATDRAAQRERLQSVGDYLRDGPASSEAVEAIDREVSRQENSEKLLAADRDRGWQTFQVRGTYLSRTEGLASGPLDLHGTVHNERHYDVYPGDGPSTTQRIRNDKVVVRLRDLSRRFEQSDFVFEGRGDSFDEALRLAFDDLAVAYPRGLVSIEAEAMRDSAVRNADGEPGTEAAAGPGTGKVLGFQRSTETTWKKVKEVVWDPVASIVTNLGAIALMTLVPGSAVIVAPALIAYNSIPSIDRIKTESDRGTLTVGTFAMSTGEIALNLLPLVSRAKPLTAGWFMVETANWGGQTALMGASAVDMAQQLQAQQVSALALEYEAFLELQKTSLPSDPDLAVAEERIRRKAAELDGEITRQFLGQLKGNFFQMAAGSVMHHVSTDVRAAIVDHLGGRAAADTHTTGDGTQPPASPPAPPTSGGAPDGAGSHARTPVPTRLASEASSDSRLRPDGDGFRANAAELHNLHAAWGSRGKGDHVSPIHYDPDTNTAHFDVQRGGEHVRVTAEVASRITSAAELGTSSNRVIGKPVGAADGHRLLRELNEGRLDALSTVGVDVPPGSKLNEGIEFGLGETSDGRVVVVLGEVHAVDWAHLPGLKPKAHTHPSVTGNDLLTQAGSERIPLTRILEQTPDPLIARELVFPSPPDVGLMARLGVDGHRVVTGFVIHDGHVMKPKPGDHSPRLEWVIEQPREVGRTADGKGVYEATLVAEVGGKPVAQVKVWSVEPPNPTPDHPGHHEMAPPPMTPTTVPARVGGGKTPASGKPTTDPVARLTTGTDAMTPAEIATLSAKHGKDVLEWAGDSLDGMPARRFLDALEPEQVAGMRDVTAAEALANLDVFGKPHIDQLVPPLTGHQLQVERQQLGAHAARGVADDKLKGGKVTDLGDHADNLAAGTATPPTALGSDSLVVDSNVLAGIKELMGGMPWSKLDAHKRNGINWLRQRAKPALPPLTGDPPPNSAGHEIIGDGYDLRAANNTLGESASMAGLDRSGFEITIGRDTTQYNLVLAELAKPPEPIGDAKGDGDRSIVADTMFAASPGNPRLMTGDNAMINRLYKRYGPGKAKPIKQKPKQSLAQAIAAAHPEGYQADIPDGLGGTRTIIVIPMVK